MSGRSDQERVDYVAQMDIKNPKLLYLKGGLFVITGALAVAGILLYAPNWRVAILLVIAIWSFARAYYFAFYVIEHYIDPGFRFAGLSSFVRYALTRKSSHETAEDQSEIP